MYRDTKKPLKTTAVSRVIKADLQAHFRAGVVAEQLGVVNIPAHHRHAAVVAGLLMPSRSLKFACFLLCGRDDVGF
jgi:hypothetical protein